MTQIVTSYVLRTIVSVFESSFRFMSIASNRWLIHAGQYSRIMHIVHTTMHCTYCSLLQNVHIGTSTMYIVHCTGTLTLIFCLTCTDDITIKISHDQYILLFTPAMPLTLRQPIMATQTCWRKMDLR